MDPRGRIESFLSAIRDNVHEHTQMVIIVLPSNNAAVYGAIKKLLCCELGSESTHRQTLVTLYLEV